MNDQPTFRVAHGTLLRRSLSLLLGAGLLVLTFRFIDDLPEGWQRPVFFLGVLTANALLYLLVTRRGSPAPGAGQPAQTLLVALAVLIHLLSGIGLLLACLFIILGVNPH